MRSPRRLVAFRGMLTLTVLVQLAMAVRSMRPVPLEHAAVFLLVLVGADLLWVRLPRGGEITAGPAAIVATALLFPSSPAVVMVAVAEALSIGVRLRRGGGIAVAAPSMERIAALSLCLPLLELGRPTSLLSQRVHLLSGEGLAAASFVLAFCACCVLLSQIGLGLSRGTSVRATLRGLVSIVGPMYAALGALGALYAVVYPSMGLWAAALLLGVLLVIRHSFNLYTEVRINYEQTLRALAEAIEAQDPPTSGHGERTAELALVIGRELGMHGTALENLTYAALLHDIGKLATPGDSLDALMDARDAEGDVYHARRGAEILGQVEYLKQTAELVRHHHDAYLASPTRGGSPLGARVIAVASRYDSLTHPDDPSAALGSPAALRRIRGEAGSLLDPKVVRALEVVLRSDRVRLAKS